MQMKAFPYINVNKPGFTIISKSSALYCRVLRFSHSTLLFFKKNHQLCNFKEPPRKKQWPSGDLFSPLIREGIFFWEKKINVLFNESVSLQYLKPFIKFKLMERLNDMDDNSNIGFGYFHIVNKVIPHIDFNWTRQKGNVLPFPIYYCFLRICLLTCELWYKKGFRKKNPIRT